MSRLLAVVLWCCFVARVSAEAPSEPPAPVAILSVRSAEVAAPTARLGATHTLHSHARERAVYDASGGASRRELLARAALVPKALAPVQAGLMRQLEARLQSIAGFSGIKATVQRWTRERVIELPPAVSWALLFLVPTLGLVVLVWLIVGFVRELFPFALSRRDPRKLKLGLRSAPLLTFTGQVLSLARAFEVETQISPSGRPIRSDQLAAVHLQFFLRDERGKEADIRLRDLDLSLRDGHVVTVVWNARRKRDESGYLAFYNHTLQSVDFVEGAIAAQLCPSRRFVVLLALLPLLWLGLSTIWPDSWASMSSLVPREHEHGALLLTLAATLLLAVFGALLRWLLVRLRMRRFKQQFKRWLVPLLDDDARERAGIANAQGS